MCHHTCQYCTKKLFSCKDSACCTNPPLPSPPPSSHHQLWLVYKFWSLFLQKATASHANLGPNDNFNNVTLIWVAPEDRCGVVNITYVSCELCGATLKPLQGGGGGFILCGLGVCLSTELGAKS